MHYRILFIGTEKQLDKAMKKHCNNYGENEIRNAKCDYYRVLKTVFKDDIGRIGGEYWGLIKNGRWYQRKHSPDDYWASKRPLLVRNKKYQGKKADHLWDKFEESERDLWDTRAKGLLKNVSVNQKILILDCHN